MSGLGGHLREVLRNLTDGGLSGFWLGGCLREVVTQGGSTVYESKGVVLVQLSSLIPPTTATRV